MRELTITIKVKAPDAVTDDDVLSLIDGMLDIGYADACDSADDPDIDNPAANLASCLDIGNPTL